MYSHVDCTAQRALKFDDADSVFFKRSLKETKSYHKPIDLCKEYINWDRFHLAFDKRTVIYNLSLFVWLDHYHYGLLLLLGYFFQVT